MAAQVPADTLAHVAHSLVRPALFLVSDPRLHGAICCAQDFSGMDVPARAQWAADCNVAWWEGVHCGAHVMGVLSCSGNMLNTERLFELLAHGGSVVGGVARPAAMRIGCACFCERVAEIQ